MKSFNWGFKIGAVYLSFVLFMLFLAYKSYQVKTELVSPDYYKDELAYEDILAGKRNLASLDEPIVWTVKDKDVQFQYPSFFKGKSVAGEIYFYKPSNSKLDKKIPIELSENLLQSIDKATIAKGAYELKLMVKCDGKTYYKESIINL